MGIEHMRRWPMFFVLGACILMAISLFNCYSVGNELTNQVSQLEDVIKDCKKAQNDCVLESMRVLTLKEKMKEKGDSLTQEKTKLQYSVSELEGNILSLKNQLKNNDLEVNNCKTELESSKNLKVTMSATMEALRYKNNKLTAELDAKNEQVNNLENEIKKLKLSLTTKTDHTVSKITPVSSVLKVMPDNNNEQLKQPMLDKNEGLKERMEGSNEQIKEPMLDDTAREQFEDVNENDTNVL